MIDHPTIDFDGDGTADSYDTVARADGEQHFIHHDANGHIDAYAIDDDHNGLVDRMLTDDDGDGYLDRMLTDDDGDGYMDTELDLGGPGGGEHNHPYIDFDGDGAGDSYYSTNLAIDGQIFAHVDGIGHVDALALDENTDGLIDVMYVDKDADARFDHVLADTNGDGIMDQEMPA